MRAWGRGSLRQSAARRSTMGATGAAAVATAATRRSSKQTGSCIQSGSSKRNEVAQRVVMRGKAQHNGRHKGSSSGSSGDEAE